MYSSKPLTKWQGASFLSSKEPYASPQKIERKKLNSRFTGCQFKCNPPKIGRDGLFSRWKYISPDEGNPERYSRRKMKHRRGFGSADVADRGEFGNRLRQSEWLERIKSEKKCIVLHSKSTPNLLEK